MSDTKNIKLSKLLVSVLFILITAAIATASIFPVFTVKSEEMTGSTAEAYEDGLFTSGYEFDEEISIGLLPIIYQLPNIKHLAFVIYCQEKSAIIEKKLENPGKNEYWDLIEDQAELADKIGNYEDGEKLEKLLHDEGFLDAVQMYYAMRYLVLNYTTDAALIMAAASGEDSEGDINNGGIAFMISLIVVPLVVGVFLAMLLGSAIIRFFTMIVAFLKNTFRLNSYLKNHSREMPDKIIPDSIFWKTGILAIFGIKMLFGDLIEIGIGVMAVMFGFFAFSFVAGFYKLIAEKAGQAKNWCRWLLRICSLTVFVYAIFALTDNSIVTVFEFIETGKYDTIREYIENYVSRLLIEFVMKIVSISFLIGYCESLCEEAEGKEIKIDDKKYVTVIGGESSIVMTIICLLLVIILSFIYPGQSFIAIIMIFVGGALDIFASLIPKILGDPDPIPQEAKKEES